ncbi:MAG TPA: hypothetical protein VF008_05500, partial [Niastella sp.]
MNYLIFRHIDSQEIQKSDQNEFLGGFGGRAKRNPNRISQLGCQISYGLSKNHPPAGGRPLTIACHMKKNLF